MAASTPMVRVHAESPQIDREALAELEGKPGEIQGNLGSLQAEFGMRQREAHTVGGRIPLFLGP
jgi:hypothetical protein